VTNDPNTAGSLLVTGGFENFGGFVLLLKLGAATHGWDFVQQTFDIPIASTAESSLDFKVPDSEIGKFVPAFYHLF
jgi:hypothetical protein